MNAYSMVKVNIGSGKMVFRGWINYDVSINIILLKYKIFRKILFKLGFISKENEGWPKEVIRRDVRKGIPLPDNSVDYIYCSHMLEHLPRNDAKVVIKEGQRLLKSGGVMRVVVPDLKTLAFKYVRGEITLEYFIEMLEFVDERPLFKRLLFPGRKHRWMYDYESLSNLLYDCGFTTIFRRSFKKGLTPDIEKLDRYPEISLYIEAMK